MKILEASAKAVEELPVVSEIWRGFVASFPVMLGFVPFALVLGAQAVKKGLSPLEVPLMTGLNFGGGSEFAAIEIWSSPPQILLIVAMTFLVNCRHLLMGATLAPFIQHLPKRKAIPALFFMCDESWAMALGDSRQRAAKGTSPSFSLPYYFGVAAGLYLTWVIFTTLGSVIGPRIGNIEAYGFDMAFTAVFLVLLKGMWKGLRAARPWLVSLVFAASTYLLVPGAWYVAAGALSGIVAAIVWAEQE
ncbi:AzlC family ABC transporter permease [bacterium]|nr:AzlC family ABC transporter permease [bacterium]